MMRRHAKTRTQRLCASLRLARYFHSCLDGLFEEDPGLWGGSGRLPFLHSDTIFRGQGANKTKERYLTFDKGDERGAVAMSFCNGSIFEAMIVLLTSVVFK